VPRVRHHVRKRVPRSGELGAKSRSNTGKYVDDQRVPNEQSFDAGNYTWPAVVRDILSDHDRFRRFVLIFVVIIIVLLLLAFDPTLNNLVTSVFGHTPHDTTSASGVVTSAAPLLLL